MALNISNVTLDTAPDQIMVPQHGECVNEVSVEESEEQQVRGDRWLGELQAGDMGQAGDGSEERGCFPGIASSSLA